MNKRNRYLIGAWITGLVAFFVIWIYALVSWGVLIGLLIGWLPAIIGGFVLGVLWPLVLLVLIGGAVLLFLPALFR